MRRAQLSPLDFQSQKGNRDAQTSSKLLKRPAKLRIDVDLLSLVSPFVANKLTNRQTIDRSSNPTLAFFVSLGPRCVRNTVFVCNFLIGVTLG